jgi:hypothetical protein
MLKQHLSLVILIAAAACACAEPPDTAQAAQAIKPSPPVEACLELGCAIYPCPTLLCDCAGVTCRAGVPYRLCSEIGCFDPVFDEGVYYCPNEVERPEPCGINYQRCAVLECADLICPHQDSGACLCTFEAGVSTPCVAP